MSSPFAPATLAELTARLEARRRAAIDLLARCRADAAVALEDLDVSDLLDGENPDGGTNGVERARALSVAQLASSNAASADAALERLAAGRYGLCDGCGTRIPLARLRALPETTVCVSCKRAGEPRLARVG